MINVQDVPTGPVLEARNKDFGAVEGEKEELAVRERVKVKVAARRPVQEVMDVLIDIVMSLLQRTLMLKIMFLPIMQDIQDVSLNHYIWYKFFYSKLWQEHCVQDGQVVDARREQFETNGDEERIAKLEVILKTRPSRPSLVFGQEWSLMTLLQLQPTVCFLNSFVLRWRTKIFKLGEWQEWMDKIRFMEILFIENTNTKYYVISL